MVSQDCEGPSFTEYRCKPKGRKTAYRRAGLYRNIAH